MKRRAALLVAAAALAGGCGETPAPALDASTGLGDAGVDAARADAARPDLAPFPSGLFGFQIDAGAFPPVGAHPNVVVYVPAGFDPTPPIAVVVFLHGFSNCVENVVRSSDGECEPDGGTRAAYALVDQLEAANKNAILVCPELAFDQPTGNPGRLGQDGGFGDLLGETLARIGLGGTGVGPVAVASHSGGYQAAAAVASRGGVPVAELFLLDSLYGDTAAFDAWAMDHAVSGRFADVYTTSGGTLANSQAMADRAASWVTPDGGALVDDRTTATWPDATYAHPLLFKHSALSHDGVPAYYFGKLVGTSSLPARP